MAEPDSPILKAFDEMRRAEQALEAARADFMVKREAWLVLFEATYGEEPAHRATGDEPWTA
jgi:hypothetical protein